MGQSACCALQASVSGLWRVLGRWPKTPRLQSAARPLEIVRKIQTPEFRFDQDEYRAGERVTGWYRGMQTLPKSAKIYDQPVPMTIPPRPLTPPSPPIQYAPSTAPGGEALLQLRADPLCDTTPLDTFWLTRTHQATGTRNYQRLTQTTAQPNSQSASCAPAAVMDGHQPCG